MLASIERNTLVVDIVEPLGNGHYCAHIKLAEDYSARAKYGSEYLNSPASIRVDGRRYVKTGWNSDKMVAYYRTDRTCAELT